MQIDDWSKFIPPAIFGWQLFAIVVCVVMNGLLLTSVDYWALWSLTTSRYSAEKVWIYKGNYFFPLSRLGYMECKKLLFVGRARTCGYFSAESCCYSSIESMSLTIGSLTSSYFFCVYFTLSFSFLPPSIFLCCIIYDAPDGYGLNSLSSLWLDGFSML